MIIKKIYKKEKNSIKTEFLNYKRIIKNYKKILELYKKMQWNKHLKQKSLNQYQSTNHNQNQNQFKHMINQKWMLINFYKKKSK